MTNRHRLEDLGRIMELLKEILNDNPLFVQKYWRRPKDAFQWFEAQTPEQKEVFIDEIAYAWEDLKFIIYEIYAIACGDEGKNESY